MAFPPGAGVDRAVGESAGNLRGPPGAVPPCQGPPGCFVIGFQLKCLLCAASSLASATRLAKPQNICFILGPGPGSWEGGANEM